MSNIINNLNFYAGSQSLFFYLKLTLNLYCVTLILTFNLCDLKVKEKVFSLLLLIISLTLVEVIDPHKTLQVKWISDIVVSNFRCHATLAHSMDRTICIKKE